MVGAWRCQSSLLREGNRFDGPTAGVPGKKRGRCPVGTVPPARKRKTPETIPGLRLLTKPSPLAGAKTHAIMGLTQIW